MKKTTGLPQQLKILALLLLSCFLLTGCKGNPKNFTSGDITITLTENFSESKMNGFDAYIVSDDLTFSAKEETVSNLEMAGYEISDLKGYATEIITLNGKSAKDLKQRDNYYYFVNDSTVKGASYTYVHCMFQAKSSYWICEFVCKSKDYKHLKSDILDWADTIEIK